MSTYTKVCTIAVNHRGTMRRALERHNVPYRMEEFTNSTNQRGIRVFIPYNLRFFFSEIVRPHYEYKKRLIDTMGGCDQEFGHAV